MHVVGPSVLWSAMGAPKKGVQVEQTWGSQEGPTICRGSGRDPRCPISAGVSVVRLPLKILGADLSPKGSMGFK